MKPLPEPDDPLSQALVEDTKSLAQGAAAEARNRRRARVEMVGLWMPLAFLLALGCWHLANLLQNRVASSAPKRAESVPPIKMAQENARPGMEYVRAHVPGEEVHDEPLRQDASPEEQELLKDLPDSPVLIVRNEKGRVASVYVFESAP